MPQAIEAETAAMKEENRDMVMGEFKM